MIDNKTNLVLNLAIYYEDKTFNCKKSIFALFVNNNIAAPIVKMPCSVDIEDVVSISKAILNEFAEIIKLNTNRENLSVLAVSKGDNRCYVEEDYMFKSLNAWTEKYGYKSERHKEEVFDLITLLLGEYFDENDSSYIETLIEYINFSFKS